VKSYEPEFPHVIEVNSKRVFAVDSSSVCSSGACSRPSGDGAGSYANGAIVVQMTFKKTATPAVYVLDIALTEPGHISIEVDWSNPAQMAEAMAKLIGTLLEIDRQLP
jgi:hypothetical protein